MKCGLNMSFANRQVILHRIRECFAQVFKRTPEEMEMHQVYDVAHNIASPASIMSLPPAPTITVNIVTEPKMGHGLPWGI